MDWKQISTATPWKTDMKPNKWRCMVQIAFGKMLRKGFHQKSDIFWGCLKGVPDFNCVTFRLNRVPGSQESVIKKQHLGWTQTFFMTETLPLKWTLTFCVDFILVRRKALLFRHSHDDNFMALSITPIKTTPTRNKGLIRPSWLISPYLLGAVGGPGG